MDLDGYERARACELCRVSKVRCEQPDRSRPCKRCAKGQRVCVPATRSQPTKSLPVQSQLSVLEERVCGLLALCQQEQRREAGEVVGWRSQRGYQQRAGPFQAPKNTNTTAFVETGMAQIVDHAEADRLFHCYCTDLAVCFPAVVFGRAVSAAQVRLSSPLLFLAVIATAARAMCSVDIQARLRVLVFSVLDSCMGNSEEYTVELLQTVVLLALWYIPAPHDTTSFEHLCYEAQHLEAGRAWLATYYLETMVSMRLPSPRPLRSNGHAEECMGMLTSSPLAQPGDATLVYYLGLQQITLDCALRLQPPSQITSPGEIHDILSQCNQAIEAQSTLRQYDGNFTSTQKAIASILYHACRVCIYEAAINHTRLAKNQRSDETQHAPCLFSSPEQSLMECLESAHNVISAFTLLPQRDIQVLPTVVLLRVIHATVVLVKIIISVSKSCSIGCHATRTQEMRVDHALDEMILTMTGCQPAWPATKWTRILLGLRRRLRESQRSLVLMQSQSPPKDYNPCWARVSSSPSASASTSTSSATLSSFGLPSWDISSPLSSFPLFHESSLLEENSLDPSALTTNCVLQGNQEASISLPQEDPSTLSPSDLAMATLLTDCLSARTLDADLSMLDTSFAGSGVE
ncbi:hypothetical protein MW887_005703 [Aspergillus wentii]|nr:hypothetical protein MW887_005703 [Aspergillus wentii]